MNMQRQILSVDDRIAEMVANEHGFDEIAAKVKLSVYEVQLRFKRICHRLGERYDDEET